PHLRGQGLAELEAGHLLHARAQERAASGPERGADGHALRDRRAGGHRPRCGAHRRRPRRAPRTRRGRLSEVTDGAPQPAATRVVLVDPRRLTGPNLLVWRPLVVVELTFAVDISVAEV